MIYVPLEACGNPNLHSNYVFNCAEEQVAGPDNVAKERTGNIQNGGKQFFLILFEYYYSYVVIPSSKVFQS